MNIYRRTPPAYALGTGDARPSPMPEREISRRDRDQELELLVALVQRQGAQIRELQQGLGEIGNLLGGSEPRDMIELQNKVEALTRLSRLEEGPALPVKPAVAPSPARPALPAKQFSAPSPKPAPAPQAAPSPQAAIPARDGQELPAALRRLSEELGFSNYEQLLTRIEAAATEQGLPWDSRGETLVKSTFALLAKQAGVASRTAPFQDFVQRMLGDGADLVVARPGDAFDPEIHHDCSADLTGTRSRVGETIFPGVRSSGRVVVRALVKT